MIAGLAAIGFGLLLVGVFGLAVREQRSYDAWFDAQVERSRQARNL